MYDFCRNSPHYEMVEKNISIKDVKDIEAEKIGKVCTSLSNDVCSFEKLSGEDICKKILYMYKFLDNAQRLWKHPSTITNEDLYFLNYWLNVKLKFNSSSASLCMNKFIEAIKGLGGDFMSREKNLEKHLHVIDPSKLENMEILCELYDTKQKITDLIFDQGNTENYKELCKDYTQKCYDKYIEGMKRCLNIYDDFYKALKVFDTGYKFLIAQETDESAQCKTSDHFRLMEYDPVLEAHQRRFMTFKIMSAPLMLPFVIPLLYKYTPFGPFLRAKIRMVKDKWMNMDKNKSELLSLSTDIENNISDNEEFNLGYYSVTS
ncbi:PIR Superfamily Protein [Plasmodium ovale curtisi]|uniref:PIR Superfamily Protein n=1 Tax=Plasmodium ovale curtisi TaxID=864141 RepID=A0A1A8WRY1_PLAOA|nr:PIR Superfamily Protein [Plasmodium ovale curtisi]